MLQLTLPPNKTPQITLYTRETATAVGSAITGTESETRPTLYDFDISAVDDGDYVVDITNPYGRFVLRVNGAAYLIADEFWELDYIAGQVDPAKDPNKVLVNHNYGGPQNLTYVLNSDPVADASIEVFLNSDYVAGLVNGNYRVAEARQKANGDWALPVYLDPDVYVLRYYKQDVAGPDVYRLNVSFVDSEISVVKLSGTTGYLRVLPETIKTNLIVVNQDYGGKNNLTYTVNDQVLSDVSIDIFYVNNFKENTLSPDYAIASTRQTKSGVWENAVSLEPNDYVIRFYKKGIAGPDYFKLTVAESQSNIAIEPISL